MSSLDLDAVAERNMFALLNAIEREAREENINTGPAYRIIFDAIVTWQGMGWTNPRDILTLRNGSWTWALRAFRAAGVETECGAKGDGKVGAVPGQVCDMPLGHGREHQNVEGYVWW